MSKEKSVSGAGWFFQELLQAGVYKRSQGRVTRQVTFAVLAIGFILAAYNLRLWLIGSALPSSLQYAIPGLLLLAGMWFAFRLVNMPRFADFLIAVEAEMNKVSWPSRTELYRSSIVVMVVIFLLAAILLVYDLTWTFVFSDILGILK